MSTKRIELIHKELDEECFEILKSTIVEDRQLKKFEIDKDTLIHELPEKVVNEFLDFLFGLSREHRQLTLEMIKNGTLIFHCWEEEEYNEADKFHSKRIGSNRVNKLEQKSNDLFENPIVDECPF